MASPAKSKATAIVTALSGDDAGAAAGAEELMPLVYDELRRLAARFMQRESPGHTLQPTALVHEAYLKLVDQTQVDWRGRSHFLAVGAQMMRRVLIDHARGRLRAKRGAGWQRVTFADELAPATADGWDPEDLLALDRALTRLATIDERQARIVELRFFAGLKSIEIADLLQVSRRTVQGDWAYARAWLKRELAHHAAQVDAP